MKGHTLEALIEQLAADSNTLADQNSDKVSSLGLETSIGIRFLLYEDRKWQFLFQTGIVGRYPASSKNVRIENQTFELLEPDLSFTAGLSVVI